jgi:transcriptional regulator with PAS, ATPase and Fis domain
MKSAWAEEFPGAIMVCDAEGKILDLNERAADSYAEEGGRKLIGSNLLDCHPEPARSKVKQLLESKKANIYTIEKNGIKKLIYQSPWYKDGKFAGVVELALEIPEQMPHFVRTPKPKTKATQQ